jgi:hypothetical protein
MQISIIFIPNKQYQFLGNKKTEIYAKIDVYILSKYKLFRSVQWQYLPHNLTWQTLYTSPENSRTKITCKSSMVSLNLVNLNILNRFIWFDKITQSKMDHWTNYKNYTYTQTSALLRTYFDFQKRLWSN